MFLARDTHWTKARLGYKFGTMIIGPEGAFYGNENFNNQRIGGFAKFPLLTRLDAMVSGGFNFVTDEAFEFGSLGGLGGVVDSAYGHVSISTWF